MDFRLKSKPKVSVNLLQEIGGDVAEPISSLSGQPQVSLTLDDASFFKTNNQESGYVAPTTKSNLSSQLQRVRNSGSEMVRTSSTPIKKLTQSSSSTTANQQNYKLTRIYSESEKSNFHSQTGHRLYDDGKIRPELSRSSSLLTDDGENDFNYYSNDDNLFSKGIEDEYIPGLDFNDLVYQWNNRSDLNLDQNLLNYNRNNDINSEDQQNDKNINHSNSIRLRNKSSINSRSRKFHESNSISSSHNSHTPTSRESSYLDLNTLHAKVAPQPIRSTLGSLSKFSYSKLTDYMKTRHAKSFAEIKSASNSGSGSVSPRTGNEKPKLKNTPSTTTLTSAFTAKYDNDDAGDDDQKSKRRKSSIIDPETDVNYENILNSLPNNFNDLPYSQRRKLVRSFSNSIDYSQFSLFAKSYLQENPNNSFGSARTSRSGGSGSQNNSFVRRPRCSSVNTIAGRLLQMSSTDLKKLEEKPPPKVNVDEKGAIVMEHELGKVIGSGAWGTIRECTDRHGTIRAMKIVKSVKDEPSPSPRSSPSPHAKQTNPKVLEVFRKEIFIWKQLNHPNILPLLKSLETETTIFCITNRIYGGTLFELVSSWGIFNASIMNTSGDLGFLIPGQECRLKQVSDCSKQIVDALKYMHEEKGIVHGDLKLENVLVEHKGPDQYKMIVCDFGMSRFFNTRLSRRESTRFKIAPQGEVEDENEDEDEDDGTLYIRSKSSVTDVRKPYNGGETFNTRNLNFNDDSKIGISNLERVHGPSLQSVDISTLQKQAHYKKFPFDSKTRGQDNQEIGIDSDLPHSHIGSLPYAAPELLSPSPPPLGPLADIWALGVLLFTMCVGKLPFQHQYEPRLRAIITAGKFNRSELTKACLLEWIFKTEDDSDEEVKLPETMLFQSPSLVDVKKMEEIKQLQLDWKEYFLHNKNKYKCLYDTIIGSLELNITKRWDLDKIKTNLVVSEKS